MEEINRKGRGARGVVTLSLLCGAIAMGAPAHGGSNRLLATGGVMQVEGSAGGGIVPWALIAGLGTDAQIGGSVYCTNIRPQSFELRSCGVAVGLYDRVELSFANQKFDLDEIIAGEAITQNVVGAKVRVFGDAVYDQDRWYPQVSVGLQYKKNSDFDFVPALLGARDDADVDVYVAATKVYLAGMFSRTWLVNATLRATRGNQLGILGFGGDRKDSRSINAEFSTAVFLSDAIVAGAEYRQKPDNLRSFKEEDYWDVFAAWFPNKHFSVTAAYADLGQIAMKTGQHGWYLSLQGSL